MRWYYLCLIILLLSTNIYSQDVYSQVDSPKTKPANIKKDTAKTNKKNDIGTDIDSTAKGIDAGDYGWQSRFAVFLGAGVGVSTGQLYNDPVINPSNNVVEIEKSQKITTSLSLGVVFTPHIYSVTRTIPVIDSKGNTKDVQLIAYVPKGISYAVFLSPVNLTKLSSDGFVNNVDVGLGIGYRNGDFLALATIDFLSVRQPRQYFVDQYSDSSQTFTIGGQTQTSIDVTNNNIFYNKLETVIGIKLCFAFSLAKSFYSSSQSLTKENN
jgi:hypothetical protein